jgi:hypothetical protein
MDMTIDKAAEIAEAKRLIAANKLLTRKSELRAHELKRICATAFETLLESTQVPVDKSIISLVEKGESPKFLTAVQKVLDCDPFMQKGPMYALMLEAWSCLYDTAKMNAQLQRNEIALLKHKKIDDLVLIAMDTRLKELQAETATYNTQFAACRVLNLVEKGMYRPPATVVERRQAHRKSFLQLFSLPHATLTAVKQPAGTTTEELQRLLDQEAEPNQLDVSTGARPVHHACMNGKAEEVRLLLRAKADANAQTLRGFTPLHFAYQYGHDDCVEVLLAHRADVRQIAHVFSSTMILPPAVSCCVVLTAFVPRFRTALCRWTA